MAVLGGTPKFQALNSVGAPLSGGKLYTYQPGTTTNKATYTSSSEASTNANPVILNSRGEADVWFVGKYKLVLKDADDVTIWTVDNYDPQTLDFTNGLVDGNDNEVIVFTSVVDAVNHIEIQNNSTGEPPKVIAAGDDANIDLVLQAKGTGQVIFGSVLTFDDFVDVAGTASNAGYIKLGENTTNGANVLNLRAPESMTADRDIKLPGEAPTNNYILKTDGSGVWSYDDVNNLVVDVDPDADDTTAGKIEIAVQSEMETGTSTTLAVTPGRQHYHPAHPKGWVKFDGTGTVAIDASHNVSSITDNGTGSYSIVWSTDFSSADYAIAANAIVNGSFTRDVAIVSMGASAITIYTVQDDDNVVDASIVTLIACGDQV